MNNFRRRASGKTKPTLVKRVKDPGSIVINSFDPSPADRTYTFASGDHYIAPINVTIQYDIYDCYDDYSTEYVSSGSWTGDITSTIISRTTSHVGVAANYAGNGDTLYDGDEVWLNAFTSGGGNDYRIYKTDSDGKSFTTTKELGFDNRNSYGNPIRVNHNTNTWEYAYDYCPVANPSLVKITLTKQGDSGTGNVLAHFESLV